MATVTTCPACARPAPGPFCGECGAAVGARPCPRCGCPTGRGSRYCGECGASLVAIRQREPLRLTPWLLGGGLGLVLVVLVWRSPPRQALAPQGLPAPGPAAAPPDLSALSPRQRFDRLFQRVIGAAQAGDQATVEQFTPMAVAAYGQLDSIDVDARYHLAMLQLHVGNLTGAQAQADSIRRIAPDHLFGYVIGAAVARWTGKTAVRDLMYREFRSRYEREVAGRRAEYSEHQAMLAEVKRVADSLGAAR